MRKFILFLTIVFSINIMGQSVAGAETFFNQKEYKKALDIYVQLLAKRPKDALLNYRAGRCTYELKDYFEAARYFEKAGTKYPLTAYYLGDSYYQTYQFEKATLALQEYVDSKNPESQKLEYCNTILPKTTLGAKLIGRIEEISIIDSTILNKSDFLQFYNLHSDLGTLKREPLKFAGKIQDKITYTTQRADRIVYSDTLKNKIELYSKYKLLEEWSAPTLLSKNLTTKSNKNYPFLLSDGITLYFGADGENSLGGYDIFMTRFSASSKDFLTPENVGFPFNSPANDYMLVIDEIQKKAWFCTDRNQQAGKVVVYSFLWNENKKYYKSTDSVAIYQHAKLLSYSKAKKTSTVNTIQQTNSRTVKTNVFSIAINDSTMYESVDNFKSEKAKQLYLNYHKTQKETEKLKNELDKARISYENALTEDKKRLADEIQKSEMLLIKLQKSHEKLLKNALNEENSYLKAKTP